MITGNLIIAIILTYYSSYLIEIIISKTKRVKIQQLNTKLNELRTVGKKTLEEQKQFINLKYPKKPKFKWRWNIIPYILYRLVLFVAFFRLWLWVFSLTKLNLAIWHAILFMVIFPILLNIILERFKMQKGDLSIHLKGWFK